MMWPDHGEDEVDNAVFITQQERWPALRLSTWDRAFGSQMAAKEPFKLDPGIECSIGHLLHSKDSLRSSIKPELEDLVETSEKFPAGVLKL